jgi:hypothetical protein
LKKKAGKPKKGAPKKNRAWFESKVAALGAALEKLPAGRQQQLGLELKQEKP